MQLHVTSLRSIGIRAVCASGRVGGVFALLIILTACGQPDTDAARGLRVTTPRTEGTIVVPTIAPSMERNLPTPQQATTTPSSDDGLPPSLQKHLKEIRDELQRTDLTPQQRQQLEAVLAANEQLAHDIRESQTNPPPKDPNHIPTILAITMLPTQTPSHGITTNFSSPFPSSRIIVENGWQDEVNGAWIGAFAGMDGLDHAQGLVVIVPYPLGTPGQDWYRTPRKSGAVHFTEAHGLLLTLVSEGGDIIVFDVATRHFLDANGNPIPPGPTPTLEPTATP